MPGRKYSAASGYRYGFNGKENDKDAGEGDLDFGERFYDSRLGKWFSVDKYYYKYRSVSPYSFALNCPIVNIDNAGDSVWTTTTYVTTTDANGFIYHEQINTLHITMKVLDISDQAFNMTAYIDKLKQDIGSILKKESEEMGGAGTIQDPRMKFSYKIGTIEVEKVSSMDDVKASDHLMVIVDEINPGTFTAGSNVGLAKPLGKISYVKNGWFTSTSDAVKIGVHEFLHNLGLDDMYSPFMEEKTALSLDVNYKTNIMYNHNGDHITKQQLSDVWYHVIQEHTNQGENSQVAEADENNGWASTSSSTKPFDSSIKKGQKIPFKLESPNKK